MDTRQINDILYKDKYTKGGFLGAVPWTQIPNLGPNQSCITNTHCDLKVGVIYLNGSFFKHDLEIFIVIGFCQYFQPGEHWLCLLHKENKIEFFDPFGFRPEMYAGIPYRVDIINDKQVQHFSAQTCGMWTTFFLLQRYREINMRDIVQPFNDLDSNDVIIAKLFFDVYAINIPVYI